MYQRKTLHSRVNTWLGTLLLCAVALWAGSTIWHAATGTNVIVQAFSELVEDRTTLPD
jgi:hypothetical protein